MEEQETDPLAELEQELTGEPAEAQDAEETPSVDEDLDSELQKFINQPVPDDPLELKKLYLKRAKEVQAIGTKRAQELAAKEKDLQAKAQKGELWDEFSSSPEYQQFLEFYRGGQQPQAAKPSTDELSAEEKVLQEYVEKFAARVFEERFEKQFAPKIRSIERYVAKSELKSLKSQYTDWNEYEGQIAQLMQKHPTLDPSEAYQFAKAANAKVEAQKELLEKVRAKREASGTLRGSSVSAEAKAPDWSGKKHSDIMKEALALAAKETGYQFNPEV